MKWSIMSIEINPREVLEHLQYLGYHDITKEQLKEFIKDLKKLIKYDQRERIKKSVERRSVAVEANLIGKPLSQNLKGNVDNSTLSTSSVDQEHFPCRKDFQSLSLNSENTYNSEDTDRRTYHPNDYIDENLTYNECDNQSCSCCKKLTGQEHLKVQQKKPQTTDKPPQPVKSFIRPGMSKPLGKCDPVALYHYYQKEWSKHTLPGEDPRSNLRWAIRSQLARDHANAQQKPISTESRRRKEWIS